MEHQRSSYRPRHRQADKMASTPWRAAGGRGAARERAGFSTRSVLVLVVLAAIAVGAWIPWYLGRAGADTVETASGAPVAADSTSSQAVDAARAETGSTDRSNAASRAKRPATTESGAGSASLAPSVSAAASPSAADAADAATDKSATDDTAAALTAPAGDADEVIELVNKARAVAGCDPVHTDTRLSTAAQSHSEDMVARDYFSHNTPENLSPWDRAKAAGYEVPTGENIALGQKTAAAVMDAWLSSEGHRANIVNCESKAIGVGVALDSSGTTYWTQMFGAE